MAGCAARDRGPGRGLRPFRRLHPHPDTKARLQWINPGNYGVFVFFIISGFIVPASLERKGSVRTFWVSRLFRLYPLYLFAIGFAVLCGGFTSGT